MNSSGEAVKKFTGENKVKPEDIYIVHDDLDIPLGGYKIQLGKGPKLHYGISSIEGSLGETDFWRVRIGVDNRDIESRVSGEEYVLQDFTQGELTVLQNVLKKAALDLRKRITDG
jgi:PTH1 family peptidyl-tRNA hydrolase